MASDRTHFSNRAGIALLALFLAGFCAILVVNLLIGRLISDLDEKSHNERNRLLIGEDLVQTVQVIERGFYQMAQSASKPALDRTAKEIHNAIDLVEQSLQVLQNGGVYRHRRALNIYGLDERVSELRYRPSGAHAQFDLVVIETAPYIDQLRQRAAEAANKVDALNLCPAQDTACFVNARQALTLYYKILPSLFFRLEENANRLHYESEVALKTLDEGLHTQQSYLLRTQVGIVLLVIGSVMGLGYFFVRQINLTQRQLERARDTAEQANRAKSDFLANMSHEIRTPMNAILGFSQLVQETQLTGRQREYLDNVQTASKSLLRLLNDILDYSKIEAGHLEIVAESYDVRDLVHSVTELFSFQVREKGLLLKVEIDDNVPAYLMGDTMRLRQVLVNLVGNALKFTERGEIGIRLTCAGASSASRQLEMAVRDSGIGMSPAHLEQIFAAFSQADNSITRRFGGTGLGLTICTRLIDLMGGNISVQSELGRGSTFTVNIPVDIAQGPHADAQAAPPGANVPGVPSVPANGLPAPAGAGDIASAAAPGPESLRGARVLLVEDDPVNAMVARAFLQDLGMHISNAGNGMEALEWITRQAFDVVLMDLQMPQMDGFEATQRIHAQLGEAAPPIIAISASAMLQDRQACLDAGMRDHLSKPIIRAQLSATLLRWIKPAEQGGRTAPGATLAHVELDRGTLDPLLRELERQLANNMLPARRTLDTILPLLADTAAEIAFQPVAQATRKLKFKDASSALAQFMLMLPVLPA